MKKTIQLSEVEYLSIEPVVHKDSIVVAGFSLTLKESDGERIIEIVVGIPEGTSILSHVHNETPPRPMTHDLMKSILDESDLCLSRVVITELIDGTYYAQLRFGQHDSETVIDCRPSDAVALATRAGVPIFCNQDLLTCQQIKEETIVVEVGGQSFGFKVSTPGEEGT